MQANTPLQQRAKPGANRCLRHRQHQRRCRFRRHQRFCRKPPGHKPLQSIDTDFDGITDTLEIEGFVFTDTLNIPHTFYSNPLEYDTNQDGLDDAAEWLQPMGIWPLP
ncbi:MAG: hypothetical protein R3D55_09745 [Chloroflexota bacterium]